MRLFVRELPQSDLSVEGSDPQLKRRSGFTVLKSLVSSPVSELRASLIRADGASTLVSSDLNELSKSFLTDRAAERFLSRVDEHVSPQIPIHSESFPTHGAVERSLPSVDPHVSRQVAFKTEADLTDGAGVRFLSCVDLQV